MPPRSNTNRPVQLSKQSIKANNTHHHCDNNDERSDGSSRNSAVDVQLAEGGSNNQSPSIASPAIDICHDLPQDIHRQSHPSTGTASLPAAGSTTRSKKDLVSHLPESKTADVISNPGAPPTRVTHCVGVVGDECVICLCDLQTRGGGKPNFECPTCKKQTHQECHEKWMSINATCPCCRANLRPSIVNGEKVPQQVRRLGRGRDEEGLLRRPHHHQQQLPLIFRPQFGRRVQEEQEEPQQVRPPTRPLGRGHEEYEERRRRAAAAAAVGDIAGLLPHHQREVLARIIAMNFTGSPSYHWNGNLAGPLTKKGLPDMRFKVNRTARPLM
jgi:hypothetical protein